MEWKKVIKLKGGDSRRKLCTCIDSRRSYERATLDFECLAEMGSMLGSGAIIVIDEYTMHGRCFRSVIARTFICMNLVASVHLVVKERAGCIKSLKVFFKDEGDCKI